jgi:hypothetical protein
MNQLTWMTHAHNLKRVNEDYRIGELHLPPFPLRFFAAFA